MRLTLIAGLLLSLAPQASGQNAASPATVPAPGSTIASRDAWLYKGSDIAPDPAWRFGTLTNGLRYAVRKNGVPPGQVSVRIRIDAGSLMETDSERGYAHLIEHLSIRGSKYVPDGETKRIWQRFGATFGSDTNAQTTPTQTVYRLDLPSATDQALDETLKILAGIAEWPNITPAALNAERPGVMAELREQQGPQERFTDAMRQTFFAGQPIADRSPIGTAKTLDAATAAGVQAFHDRWYRPERAVVIISGDVDPATLETLVQKHFAAWRGVGPAPAEPDFGSPSPKQPATAAVVEPGLPVAVMMGVMRPWHFNNDTVLFNQNRMVDSLAAQVINRRLETRARAGGSFLQASVRVDDQARSANATMVSIVPIGDDWEAALKDVRAVIADAEAAAPSQAEIDRELADFDTALRTQVETSRVEASAAQADNMVEALDIRETVTSPATAYTVLQDARRKRMFTPARLIASTRRIFQGDATRALINTHTPDAAIATTLAAALKTDVTGFAGQRSAQAKVGFSKLPRLGKPATVVSREKIPDLGVEKVVFSNGVRMMMFASTSEPGRVYVRVRFGGGYNALPADRNTPSWAADAALVASGIGTLKQGDLDQLMAGRRIGIDFGIEDDAFSYSGLTSSADLYDELRLIAAKMEAPGWDPAPVSRIKSAVLAQYPTYSSSPDGVVARDLEGLLHDGDARWGTPTPDEVKATTAKDFRGLWEPLLEKGPIEVQVFGDVQAEAAIKAVANSIGTLKPRAADTVAAPPVRFPAHNAVPVVRTHDGLESQAAGVIAWPTGGGVDGVAEARRLDVLAAIFSDRLFDRLRLEAGASYSPNVSSSWPIGMTGGGRLIAIGLVPPDKTTFFFQVAREIAADLALHPIGDDELKRTMLPLMQTVMRSMTGSQFWMQQLTGGSYDERRVNAVLNLHRDLTGITAANLQETARKYLRPDTDWTMEVIPRTVAERTGVPAQPVATSK